MLSKKQARQEEEYQFPYHHLLKRDGLRSIEYYSYLDIVDRILKKERCRRVIEIGCGDGKSTIELQKYAQKICGVDYSAQAIRFAQAFAPGIDFHIVDCTEENANKKLEKGKWDAVVCIEVLEHLEPQKMETFINNMAALLPKGGVSIITTPTTNLRLPEKHYQHFNEKKLDRLLSRHFQKKKVIHQQNKYTYKLFFLLRGLFTNRWYDTSFPGPPGIFRKMYQLLVEKATRNTGQRIIYIGQKNET